MKWTVEKIMKELIELDEHQRIEAKRASSIGHSVMQTICAFANKPGLGRGWLLLGVDEPDSDHDTFWVNGVEKTDKLLGELKNNCRNQFEHPIQIECQHAKIDGKSVIGVFVYELEPSAKSCRFVGKPDKHMNLSDDEAKALIFVLEMEPIDNAALRTITDLNTLEASQLLGKLWQKYHLLEKVGSGRNTYYRATPLLLQGSNREINKQDLAQNTQELPRNTRELARNAQEFVSDTQELPQSLREAIEQLTPKTREPKLQYIILQLCELRAWAAKEWPKNGGKP